MAEKRKALVFGGSGLVGTELLQILGQHASYDEVLSAGRRTLPAPVEGVREEVVSLDDLSSLPSAFGGADVFVCLGTTQKKTPDNATYYKIDHDYPVAIAQEAAQQGSRLVVIVSAMGANPNSRIFYNATKGKMEADALAAFPGKTFIVRPSLIMGNRGEKRMGEGLAQRVFSVINPVLPAKLRGIQARTIAKAIVAIAHQQPVVAVLENDRLLELGA